MKLHEIAIELICINAVNRLILTKNEHIENALTLLKKPSNSTEGGSRHPSQIDILLRLVD